MAPPGPAAARRPSSLPPLEPAPDSSTESITPVMRTSAPERSSPGHTREGPGVNPQPPALGIALPSGGAPGRPGPDVCRYLDSEPPHGAHGDARDGAKVVGRHNGALLGAAHARHALSIPKQRGEQRERLQGRGGRQGRTGRRGPSPCPSPAARTTWPTPSSPSSYSPSASRLPAPPRWSRSGTRGST